MATNFPTSADDATTVGGDSLPAAGTALSDSTAGHPSHSDLHENVGDAVQAVEAKVGTGSSTPAANTVLTGTGSGTSGWATVSTAMIADDAVTQAKIADDAVGADQLAASAVVTASIVDDNVTQAKIADDAVGADQLAANAVVTASIVDDNVTQAKIADDAVGADQLASDAVVTASIVNNAVTAAKLADDAVSAGDLTGGTLASGVTASSLTSVGTLGSLTVSGGVEVQGLLDVSSQAKIEFGNENDQIRYSDTDNQFQFWADGNKHATLGAPSIRLHRTDGTLIADSPPAGTGNDAEWAVALGTNILYQNTSVAADKENISADLGTHLTAAMIDSVVPKMWNRKTAPGIPEIGPIADEVDEVSPFLAAHGTDADGDQVLTGINKTAWMSLMTLALQDIRTRLAALEG